MALLMQSVTPQSLTGLMAGCLKKRFFKVFVKNLEGEGSFALIGFDLNGIFQFWKMQRGFLKRMLPGSCKKT